MVRVNVNSRRSAFTLLELILVVVIIALMGAMAYPSLQSTYLNLRLNSAADEIRAAWAMGRLQAVNEGRPYRFAVVPNKGNYRLAPDSNDFWNGNPPMPAPDPKAEGPIILERALAKGVRLGAADQPLPDVNATDDTVLPAGSIDPAAYQAIVTFLPDGSSRDDTIITLVTKGATPLQIKLRGITGAVTVYPIDANGQPLTTDARQ